MNARRRHSVMAILLTAVLCIVAAFWVLSYSYAFTLGWVHMRHNRSEWERTYWGFYVQPGQVGFGRSYAYADSVGFEAQRGDWDGGHELVARAHLYAGSMWAAWDARRLTDTLLVRAGFDVVNESKRIPRMIQEDRAVLVPWWAVFSVMAAVTARWTFFRERRLIWGKVGRCAACGYDLRGSSGRCPECGAAVGTTSEANPADPGMTNAR